MVVFPSSQNVSTQIDLYMKTEEIVQKVGTGGTVDGKLHDRRCRVLKENTLSLRYIRNM